MPVTVLGAKDETIYKTEKTLLFTDLTERKWTINIINK